jgi:phosphoadenosine phosphosulfate reductase
VHNYEGNIFGLDHLVEKSIRLLKQHEPPDGYYVAFSGGKDSTVMLDLVKRGGVNYDAHYNVTTVDPPELALFIRQQYPEIKWERPSKTMYQLIEDNMTPPTRLMRYCCRLLKEHGGEGRTVVTGIRAEESQARARRNEIDSGKNNPKDYVHPIFMWSKNDIWQYISERQLPYCSLYDEGFERLGCIGCPMAGAKERERQFERWPGIARAYVAAMQKAVNRRIAKGKKQVETSWKTGQEMFDWWMERSIMSQ